MIRLRKLSGRKLFTNRELNNLTGFMFLADSDVLNLPSSPLEDLMNYAEIIDEFNEAAEWFETLKKSDRANFKSSRRKCGWRCYLVRWH